MLGQLQDAGNTTTLAHYLELLTGAGMIAGIQKFSLKQNRSKSSSPKLQVFNTALMAAQSGKSFHEAQNDPVFWGRLIESSVGAHLINGIRGTQIQLFYWREGQQEVDYVLQLGDKLLALEVKSNHRFEHLSGMSAFKKSHPQTSTLLVGSSNLSLKEFFEIPINSLFQYFNTQNNIIKNI